VKEEVEKEIRSYLGSLQIDEDVVQNQVIKAGLSVKGIRDIRELTINKTKENIEIKMDEKGELRLLEIFVED
jgi:uncharacterized Zn ribbon protein